MQSEDTRNVVGICRAAAEAMISERIQWRLDPKYILALCDTVAALSDKQAGEVKIKPLEWKLTHEGIEHANFMGVVYYARGDGRWGHTLEVRQNQSGSGMEAAKADAQADYEQRIRSALVDVPAVELEQRRFKLGDRVRKHSGAWWEGSVVGFYSTSQTPVGYCVQLDTVENGPVQIYPESAFELSGPNSPPLSREGEDIAEVERLREAARRIAPYLRWTIGDESPGHHPTMRSAVAAFMCAFGWPSDAAWENDMRRALAATRSGSATTASGTGGGDA